MLVLTRRIGETVVIGEDAIVTITVLGQKGNQTCIGINAPRNVPIDRQEVYVQKQNRISMKNFSSINTLKR